MGSYDRGNPYLCAYFIYTGSIRGIFKSPDADAGSSDSQRVDSWNIPQWNCHSAGNQRLLTACGYGYGYDTGYFDSDTDSDADCSGRWNESNSFWCDDGSQPGDWFCNSAHRSQFVCGFIPDSDPGSGYRKEGNAADPLFPCGFVTYYIYTADQPGAVIGGGYR